MKKIKCISIAMLLLFTANITLADDNMYNQQIKYYNNLATCTPSNFSIGYLGTYTIYGVENNKCHIRESLGGVNINCFLPGSVARRYAQEGINMLKASMKNGVSYSAYINQITNDSAYCSLK